MRYTFLSPAGTNAGAKVILFPELATPSGRFFYSREILDALDNLVNLAPLYCKNKKNVFKGVASSGNCITFAPALVPTGLRKVLGIDVQPPQGQLFKLQD